MNEGYLSWSQYAPFRLAPRLAGVDLSRLLRSIGTRPSPAGVGIDMLDGGTVYQRQPMATGAAATRSAVEIDLEFSVATRDDLDTIRRMHQLCRMDAQTLTLWDIQEDVWMISGALVTSWSLSRDAEPLPPETPSGRLIDASGAETMLTLVAGTPSAGEIAVAVDSATTADLTASAGSLLCVRYYPRRLVLASELEEALAGSDHDLTARLTLREHLPSR